MTSIPLRCALSSKRKFRNDRDDRQPAARRPAPGAQRVLRRGGIRAGQEPGLPHRRDGGGKPLRRPPAAEDDGQSRSLSGVLPTWHHHGLARPRLGRRADRVGLAEAASDAARHQRFGPAFHIVSGRLPGVLVAAYRRRRAGAEDPGHPRAGGGVAVDRLSAACLVPAALSFELAAQRRVALDSARAWASRSIRRTTF